MDDVQEAHGEQGEDHQLLRHAHLQLPDDRDGKEEDEEVGGDEQARVGEPEGLRMACCSLDGGVPVGLYGRTCREDDVEGPDDGHGHDAEDDVGGDTCPAFDEDLEEEQEDGDFTQMEARSVEDDGYP